MSSFVWDAPSDFSEKRSLLPIYGQEFSSFFCDTVGMPNASVPQVIEYLKKLVVEANTGSYRVISVYEYLQSLWFHA